MLSFKAMSSTYHKNIAEGRCGQCGKINDRPNRAVCSECAKKDVINQTETRNWYRDHGYCPRCKKNKLMGQEKTCVECRAKGAERLEIKRESDRKAYNDSMSSYHKSLYNRRKEQGLCPVCGKANKDKRYVTCNICRNKKNSRTKPKTLKDERIKNGLCIWCDSPVKDGYKICEIHYQMNCEKSKKANRDYLRKSNKALFIKY